MSVPLWARRKFFDDYGNRENEQAAALPPRGVRFTCPCCGYPMLGERSLYEICKLCRWEDDGQDDADANAVWGGPNQSYSLTEARTNFEHYLTFCRPEEDRRIGGGDSETEQAIKRAIISAFDTMLSQPTPDRLNELWQAVRDCEKALDRELNRRLRQHSRW